MNASGQRSWIRAALLVGVAYVVIGVGFTVLDDSPDVNRVRLWRLAAWAASAAVGVVHVLHDHFRRHSTPHETALHAAAAVALGAFGLALAANLHWLFAATPGQRAPLLALPIWPIITALPVFLIVLAVAAVLARFARRVQATSPRIR